MIKKRRNLSNINEVNHKNSVFYQSHENILKYHFIK